MDVWMRESMRRREVAGSCPHGFADHAAKPPGACVGATREWSGMPGASCIDNVTDGRIITESHASGTGRIAVQQEAGRPADHPDPNTKAKNQNQNPKREQQELVEGWRCGRGANVRREDEEQAVCGGLSIMARGGRGDGGDRGNESTTRSSSDCTRGCVRWYSRCRGIHRVEGRDQLQVRGTARGEPAIQSSMRQVNR